MMRVGFACTRSFAVAFSVVFVFFFTATYHAEAVTVTTTLAVKICNDGIINPGEACDDGVFLNTGAYGSTTAGRHCNSTCSGFGPYCGDATLQSLYSEQCDDGNAVNGDGCTDRCVQEFPPTSTSTPPAPTSTQTFPLGGGGGGGGVFEGNIPVRAQTKVILEGKAYPSTSVNVLKDGIVLGVVQSDAEANFSYENSTLTPGPTTFGFWALDGRGIRSITYTTTFQVTQNAVTTVSNVFLPPTLDLKSKKVSLGDRLDALGSTAPNAKVSFYVDKERDTRATGTSSVAGLWNVTIPTDGLGDETFHALKVMFEAIGDPPQAKSGFSQALNFYVGTRNANSPISADLNGDGKVNLVDFSILLFHFGTDHALADINTDGKVDLTDFSIMLFHWTG